APPAANQAAMEYVLERQQYIDRPRHEVFEYFSRAENLQVLTPSWLGFQILTPLPIEMEEGTRIDYRIRLLGVPMGWRTRILAWRPQEFFIDTQERGPYALWEHTHRFESLGNGTLMTDVVR